MKGNVYRLYIEQIRKVVNKRKKRSLEENSVMNKRRIVKEIMNPYMDKNGFTLAKYERGDWYYLPFWDSLPGLLSGFLMQTEDFTCT